MDLVQQLVKDMQKLKDENQELQHRLDQVSTVEYYYSVCLFCTLNSLNGIFNSITGHSCQVNICPLE